MATQSYSTPSQEHKDQTVIYARVSTEDQADRGISLDAQLAACADYCTGKGLNIVDSVVDPGFSAKSLNRPGLKRILDMVNHREVHHVACYRLDRLSRSVVDALQVVSLMARKGVQLHIVSEQGTVKSDTADDEFLLTLKAGLAQRERKLIGERTAFALRRKRERREFCGGQPPFGFQAVEGKLVPDMVEQRVVKDIRTLRNRGYSIRRIVRRLGEKGYVNRKGRPFTKTAVERIVKAYEETKAA